MGFEWDPIDCLYSSLTKHHYSTVSFLNNNFYNNPKKKNWINTEKTIERKEKLWSNLKRRYDQDHDDEEEVDSNL